MKMEMWLNFFGKVLIAAAIIVAALLIVKELKAIEETNRGISGVLSLIPNLLRLSSKY